MPQDSLFNSDELTAQRLAGGGPRGVGIHEFMPEQHRHFFALLPYIFLGAVDARGWPLATLLIGAPGFIQSPDPGTLYIAARAVSGDPATPALAPGRQIGILGIDFATRRRIRANGEIIRVDDNGITVAVSQSFGNCPQYIQARRLEPFTADVAGASANSIEVFDHLDDAARTVITKADTFFVASHSRSGTGPAFGADISHRGGLPGFVRVRGDELTVPDFRGNRYFNTLGNLIAEPRASLLFVDFERGDLLQLQGQVEVDWHPPTANPSAGADEPAAGLIERQWRFSLTRGWRRRAAVPLRWSFVDYARTTRLAGVLS